MQRGSPKISIIVPVYNVGTWLPACLKSVQNQSFTDWELVAVNDGSTDSSLAILEQAAAHDKRIQIITQTNQGPSAARKRGVLAARAPLRMFLDADDCISANYCEQMYQAHTQTGAELIIAPMQRFEGENRPEVSIVASSLFAEPPVIDASQKVRIFEDFSAVMALCGKMFTAALAQKIEWTVSAYHTGDDIFPSVQLLTRAQLVALQPQAVYYYRVGRSDSQSAGSPNRFAGLFDGFSRACQFLKDTGNYLQVAVGFEYVRRACLVSFIEKYGLTRAEEDLLFKNRAALTVPSGTFRGRSYKFRLRQILLETCLKYHLSYAVLATFFRQVTGRK